MTTDPAPLDSVVEPVLDAVPQVSLDSTTEPPLDSVLEVPLDSTVEPPLDSVLEALVDPGLLDQIRDVLAARQVAQTQPDLLPDAVCEQLLDPELLVVIDELLDAREELTAPFLDLEAVIAERADQARVADASATSVPADAGRDVDQAWYDEGWTATDQDLGVDLSTDFGDDLGSDVGEGW